MSWSDPEHFSIGPSDVDPIEPYEELPTEADEDYEDARRLYRGTSQGHLDWVASLAGNDKCRTNSN